MNKILKENNTIFNVPKKSKLFNNVDIILKCFCFMIKYNLIYFQKQNLSFVKTYRNKQNKTTFKPLIFNINLSSYDRHLCD